MDANLSGARTSRVSTAITLVSLFTAVVVGALNAKLVPPAAFWLCAVGFVLVAFFFLLPWMRAVRPGWTSMKAKGRIRRRYREQILALCRALRPLSEQACVYSVGSILNAAINHKLLSATCVIAYQSALATLFDHIQDLQELSPHISDSRLMCRAHAWLQAYVRICDGIGGEIRTGMRSSDMQPGIKESFLRDWLEIYQRANALRDEYFRIGYGIRSIDAHASIPEYLSPVPSLAA